MVAVSLCVLEVSTEGHLGFTLPYASVFVRSWISLYLLYTHAKFAADVNKQNMLKLNSAYYLIAIYC